jgi:hypothetical protein
LSLQRRKGIQRSCLQRTRRLHQALCQQRRAIFVETERRCPDIADHAVNLVGRSCYPVTGGTIPDDAARALQAQPDGEQPVHDIARELRHRVLRGRRIDPVPATRRRL